MPGLGEEGPAFRQQAQVLDAEGGEGQQARLQAMADQEEDDGHREDQQQKQGPDAAQGGRGAAMAELPGVEAAAGGALGER